MEPTGEEPPVEIETPPESAAEPDPPAPVVEPVGRCSKCDARVPLSATTVHERRRFHTPPPAPKGFRPSKGSARLCGPVLTAWYYRIAYSYVTGGQLRHGGLTLQLPWALQNQRQFEAIEQEILGTLAEKAPDASDVTILTYELVLAA